MTLKTLLMGKLATHCTYCGETTREGERFEVLPMQVYCSEEHAKLDQQNNPL